MSEVLVASSAAAEPPEPPPPSAYDRAPRPFRSVEFLLAGDSVKRNRHLRCFAAAAYLPRLLADDRFDALLRRKGRSLRKELSEAYAVVEALATTSSNAVLQNRFIDPRDDHRVTVSMSSADANSNAP